MEQDTALLGIYSNWQGGHKFIAAQLGAILLITEEQEWSLDSLSSILSKYGDVIRNPPAIATNILLSMRIC